MDGWRKYKEKKISNKGTIVLRNSDGHNCRIAQWFVSVFIS